MKEEKYKGSRIGKRIRHSRELKGYSQKILANACDIPQPMLSQIEQGNANITESQLKRIASHLETTIEYLLYGEEAISAKTNNSKTDADTNMTTGECQYAQDLDKVGKSQVMDEDALLKEIVISLDDEMRINIQKIITSRDERVEDTLKEIGDRLSVELNCWVDENLHLAREKMLNEKQNDVASLLEGLDEEEIQRVLSGFLGNRDAKKDTKKK